VSPDLAALQRDHEYLDFLMRVGELIDKSLDYKETLRNVCEAAAHTIADLCYVVLANGHAAHLAASAHRDGDMARLLPDAGRYVPSYAGDGRHALWRVIRSQQPLLIPQMHDADVHEFATSDEHAAFIRTLQYASIIIVPLVSRTQGVLGAMSLVRTGADARPYDETDLRFAGDLGRRCASAIAKSMMYSQTVNIATRFQRSALPQNLPEVPGLTFDAYYEPSSEDLLVGGDWYDAFELPDGRVAITIGDVLGHGIDAAVWMGRLRNSLRATLCTDPDAMRAIAVADHLMRLESRDEFSTALIAIVDPEHRTMTCASAGHPGPLIWENDGTVTDPFYERGLPLGLRTLGSNLRTAQTIALGPGCFGAFFTDGLLEWNRDVLGAWAALSSALESHDVREAKHPAQAIRDAVIKGEKHHDDIAVLTVRMDERRATP
jgi:GAF domain-containing protein